MDQSMAYELTANLGAEVGAEALADFESAMKQDEVLVSGLVPNGTLYHKPCKSAAGPLGRSVLKEMDRVGMLVDCSHCAYRTTREVIARSEPPVIFSHSNARRLCDHERNIWDEQIQRCAARGGLVGVTGVGLFLGPNGA